MKLPDSFTEIAEDDMMDMWERIQREKEVLESALSVIRTELLERLSKQKTDGKRIGRYAVSVQKRLNLSEVPLSYAKEVGAITEAVDTAKLRTLFNQGVKVPNATMTKFVSIREMAE